MKIKIEIKKWILIILASLAFAGVLYVHNSVLIISFEQLLFGVLKLKGGGVSTISYGFTYVVVSFFILCPILLLPVIDFGKKCAINIKDKSFWLYPIRNVKKYGICLFVVSVFLLLVEFRIFPYIKNTVFSSTDLFDKYYVDSSKVEISFPKEKKNLIYIMVESLESSNISIENGGLFEESIIPNLEQIAIDNINFSNSEDIGGAYYSFGTNWTTGAMLAHTSGIPFKVSLDDVKANSARFMDVTTIGDILGSNGYNNYLLIGSDADFGSRRSYFANHDYLIYDYVSMIDDGKLEDDYYEWWGYEDSKLFGYAKEILSDIAEEDRPFNFTMLTADTHFTDGYLDKSCDRKFDDIYSDVFYCSDSMIYNFIEWIKEQDFYEDTTIVIVGDHLTMQDGFYEESFENRNIYNAFINVSVNGEYENKHRVFTSMDMFPTTIASLGANIRGDRLGLGTNLFSDEDTIPEIMGIDEFNSELMKWSHYYYNNIRK